MFKKLMTSAAIGALMVSGALAQSPSASSNSTKPSAAMQTPQSSGKADFVMSQKPDQWLASKFKGTKVMSADNQNIGAISDVLFDKTGKIEAFIVGVGGFLGVGTKEVALTPSSFDVIPGANGKAPVLKLSLNIDELKQAWTEVSNSGELTWKQSRPDTVDGDAVTRIVGVGAKPGDESYIYAVMNTLERKYGYTVDIAK